MLNISKYIVLLLVTCFLISSVSLRAEDAGRFVITQAGDRTFLLDTKTGESWKFVSDTPENLGWHNCFIHDFKDDNEVVMMTPHSPIFAKKNIKD